MTKAQKIQIATPLVTLGAVALIVALFHGHNTHRNFILSRASQIGHDLVLSTNSDALIAVGPEFNQKLGSFLVSTARVETVMWGDEPTPIGDGKASCRVFLINGSREKLAIRLKQASDAEKFQILGFWTP